MSLELVCIWLFLPDKACDKSGELLLGVNWPLLKSTEIYERDDLGHAIKKLCDFVLTS